MTKAEIVQALYTRVGGFSKKESADIVDLVFEMMKETLGRGEKIKISGFGNFVLRDKRQRPGRNPQTGDPIKISERRVLTFKASQILKQALNTRLERSGSSPQPVSGTSGTSGTSGSSNGANGSLSTGSPAGSGTSGGGSVGGSQAPASGMGPGVGSGSMAASGGSMTNGGAVPLAASAGESPKE
ncbi:MAG: Integration host factor alpha subunit [Labilithrix sp.]|nr:Integration host factor alpha subunit [Labilithrix sp.]